MQRDGQGDFHFAGAKLRLKWLPWQLGEDGVGWYGGVNTELSRVGKRFSESRWQSELRPIIGYKAADWHFAFNPILDWDLSDALSVHYSTLLLPADAISPRLRTLTLTKMITDAQLMALTTGPDDLSYVQALLTCLESIHKGRNQEMERYAAVELPRGSVFVVTKLKLASYVMRLVRLV